MSRRRHFSLRLKDSDITLIMALSPKIRQEKAFLRFLLENPNTLQSKKFLQTLLTDGQYKVLQELATNCIEERIPYFSHKSQAQEYINKFRHRLNKLKRGQLKDKHLHHLLELIQILVLCSLKHYNKKLLTNLSLPASLKKLKHKKHDSQKTISPTNRSMGKNKRSSKK
jgi:hypothetical protein